MSLTQARNNKSGAPNQKPLSCTNCRARKVKCNKYDPCEPCQKAELECVFPTRRVRAKAVKRQASDTRDVELLRRIKRLESLLSRENAESAFINSTDTVATSSDTTSISTPIIPGPHPVTTNASAGLHNETRLEEKYTTFIKRQKVKPGHLDGEFWSTLGDEFQGLRNILEGNSEGHDQDQDQEEDDEDISGEDSLKNDDSPNLVLYNHEQETDLTSCYPPDSQRATMFEIYFTNVDPFFKILHKPTAYAFQAGAQSLMDPRSGRIKFRSLEAVLFAVFFAAVTSITDAECLQQLGEERSVMIVRYRRCTEKALMDADYLNSVELVTLQTLTLYNVAMLANKMTGTCWSLIGLALRIAHGLGFHRDEGGGNSIFDGEMRRRLWWQILKLEMLISDHRGSQPLVFESSFNVRLPANINDEDFNHDMSTPFTIREGITDSTMSVVAIDGLNTIRKINFAPPLDSDGLPSISATEELVQEFTKRCQTQYLKGHDQSNPVHAFVFRWSRWWILRAWLTVQYPLKKRTTQQLQFPKVQGLRTAVALLETCLQNDDDVIAARYQWFNKTFAPWHALAVALTELCRETHGPLAERAWPVVEDAYRTYSESIAGTKEVEMWRPVTSLLKRARAARERLSMTVDSNSTGGPLTLNSLLQDCEMSNTPATSSQHTLTAQPLPADTSSLIPQAPIGVIQQGSMEPEFEYVPNETLGMAMNDLDLFNINDLEAMVFDPHPLPMNWEDWNNFVYDFDSTEPIDLTATMI